MNLTDYVGLLAGFFITCSFIPQLIRVFRLKSAREISVLFTGLLLVGMALWLSYGILLGLVPIMVWNIVGGVLILLLFYAKMKYGRTGT